MKQSVCLESIVLGLTEKKMHFALKSADPIYIILCTLWTLILTSKCVVINFGLIHLTIKLINLAMAVAKIKNNCVTSPFFFFNPVYVKIVCTVIILLFPRISSHAFTTPTHTYPQKRSWTGAFDCHLRAAGIAKTNALVHNNIL